MSKCNTCCRLTFHAVGKTHHGGVSATGKWEETRAKSLRNRSEWSRHEGGLTLIWQNPSKNSAGYYDNWFEFFEAKIKFQVFTDFICSFEDTCWALQFVDTSRSRERLYFYWAMQCWINEISINHYYEIFLLDSIVDLYFSSVRIIIIPGACDLEQIR